MQKLFSKEVLELLQKILILVCVAIPPWLSFVKHFRSIMNKAVVLVSFIVYGFLTYKAGEIPPFVLVIAIIFFIYHKDKKEELYYLRPLEKKKGEVFLLSVGFKLIITIVNMWFAFVLMGFGIKLVPQEISKVFMNASWIEIIYLSALTVIAAPILEEFIFRHTLYRQLSKRIGRITACILTSLLFALLHFNFLGTISFVGVGVFNCYLYDKYGYRAAVFNHCVFNSISTIMMIGLKLYKG